MVSTFHPVVGISNDCRRFQSSYPARNALWLARIRRLIDCSYTISLDPLPSDHFPARFLESFSYYLLGPILR